MIIKYEITTADFVQYYKEVVRGMTLYTVYTINIFVLSFLFIFADAIIALYAMMRNDGSIKVDSFNLLPRAIFALVISGILWLIIYLYSKRAKSRIAAPSGKNGQFCEHTIAMDDTGFTEETEFNRNVLSWEGVEKVSETEHYVVIHVRMGSAYIIPKRSFHDANEQQAFIHTVHGHIQLVDSSSQSPM